VSFDYNLTTDSPEKVANEMKQELGLPADDIERIRNEIKMVISKLLEKESD